MKFEILVPLTLIVSMAGVMTVALYLRARTRHRALEIIREALEHGAPLDRATVEAIASGYRPEGADLRRGALLLAFAAATWLFSLALDDRAATAIRGLSAFPSLLGAAYVGFHFTKLRGL